MNIGNESEVLIRGFINIGLLFVALFFAFKVNAQNCVDAREIIIDYNGYGMGMFVSEEVDLSNSNTEFGEFFPDGFNYLALDHKTTWFKFTINTTRSARLELRQRDSAINQNAVGMVIYKGLECLPGSSKIEPRLVPLNKFGEVSSNCLERGEYLIQVCASHKANDTIWLQLTLGEPPLYYDFKATAHDFGAFSGSRSLTLETACLSIESREEKHDDLPDIYEKTAWSTFSTESDHASLSVNISPVRGINAPIDTVYAVLYKGDARNEDLEKLKDTLIFFHGEPGPNSAHSLYHKFDCFLESNQRYSIQMFFKNQTRENYSLQVYQFAVENESSSNPNLLLAEHQLGDLNLNQTINSTGNFSCGSYIKNNLCEPANSTTLPIIHDLEYDLVSWRTFSLTTESVVSIAGLMTYCGSGAFLRNWRLAFRLFEGDISSNCDLPILNAFNSSIEYTICLKPGTYSIQILGLSNISVSMDHCFNTFLGEKFVLNLSSTLGQTPVSSQFGIPKNAEALGSITDDLNNDQSILTQLDYINPRNDEDTLKIANCNSRVYREFYLSEPTSLNIRSITGGSMFLKGRVSLGMDSLQIIQNRIGFITGNHHFGNLCDVLDSGWYSFIGCATVLENCLNNYVQTYSNQLELRKKEMHCRNTVNLTPSGAMNFRLSDDDYLLFDSTPNPGTDSDIAKRYIAGDVCLVCDSANTAFINKVYYSCSDDKDTTEFHSAHFFYFMSDSIFDLEIADYRKIFLFKGDYRNDSLGLLDPSNKITPCVGGNELNPLRYYCGIDPGTYTLVLFNVSSNTIFNQAIVWIDNHIKPKFDHVKTAYQFGELSNGVEVVSPTDVISCLTGAHREHPGLQNIHSSTLLDYPLEQHKAQPEGSINRNLWYTFTVRGAGEVEIFLENRSRNSGSVRFAVYESTSDAQIPFDIAYNQGLIDSNAQMGLKLVLPQNGKFPFGNPCVDDNSVVRRYFIVATLRYAEKYYGPYLKKFIRFKVKCTQATQIIPPGDNCSNANAFTVNGEGNFVSGPYGIVCHTLGSDFGEDGSNLSCLDPGTPFKTTWVKVSISNIIKGDIAFSITPALDPLQLNNGLRYRVLYGDCGALTPGPCISHWGSSFRLDCMPPGDYFIQVATPAEANGTFRVNVQVTPSLYPDCKPASLFEPFANFHFDPPCNDSLVSFQNWSTSGENISYLWDFGNGQYATDKNPVFQFSSSKEMDTFHVTLLVTHAALGGTDSITKSLRIRKYPLGLNINTLVDSFCHGFVKVEAVSQDMGAHTIGWQPSPAQVYQNGKIADFEVADWITEFSIVAKIINDECRISDTLDFARELIMPLDLDSVICTDDSVVYDLSSYMTENNIRAIQWFDGSDVPVKKFVDTGTYWVEYEWSSCRSTDSFYLQGPIFPSRASFSEKLFCASQVYTIGIDSIFKNPLWFSGENSHRLTGYTEGYHYVTYEYRSCLYSDTFYVQGVSIPNLLHFTDTAKCREDAIQFVVNSPDFDYLWSDGSEQPHFIVENPGTYSIQISDTMCDSTYYFTVSNFPETLELPQDTATCEVVEIILDAGEGLAFLWEPTQEATQIIRPGNFGSYTVYKTNEYGCKEVDSFEWIQYCGPKIFVPNTFSPNGDGLNDLFLPSTTSLHNYKMTILNRWGEILFRSDKVSEGWDGTYQGVECQVGIYAYIIEYEIEEEGKYHKGVQKGTLQLLR